MVLDNNGNMVQTNFIGNFITDTIVFDNLEGGYGNPIDNFNNGTPTHYAVRITDNFGCQAEFGPIPIACTNPTQ